MGSLLKNMKSKKSSSLKKRPGVRFVSRAETIKTNPFSSIKSKTTKSRTRNAFSDTNDPFKTTSLKRKSTSSRTRKKKLATKRIGSLLSKRSSSKTRTRRLLKSMKSKKSSSLKKRKTTRKKTTSSRKKKTTSSDLPIFKGKKDKTCYFDIRGSKKDCYVNKGDEPMDKRCQRVNDKCKPKWTGCERRSRGCAQTFGEVNEGCKITSDGSCRVSETKETKTKKAKESKTNCELKSNGVGCKKTTGDMDSENCYLNSDNECRQIEATKKTVKAKAEKLKGDASYEKLIDNFNIGDKIGEGKDAIVYKVTDKKGRKLAMKQFRSRKTTSKFEQEIDIHNKAASEGLAPKIISMYAGKPKSIIMESMNFTLPQYVEKKGNKLSESDQKKLLQLHTRIDKHNIYHGDPNPENIMIDTEGKFKFIDFGSAKEKTIKTNDYPNVKNIGKLLYSKDYGLVSKLKLLEKDDLSYINGFLKKLDVKI